jgi:hypothetical protein
MNKTDPKLRPSRRFHDFSSENSDGIFDGIPAFQPKLFNEINGSGS